MTYSPQLDKYPRTRSYHPEGKTFDDIGDPFAHPMTYKEQNETHHLLLACLIASFGPATLLFPVLPYQRPEIERRAQLRQCRERVSASFEFCSDVCCIARATAESSSPIFHWTNLIFLGWKLTTKKVTWIDDDESPILILSCKSKIWPCLYHITFSISISGFSPSAIPCTFPTSIDTWC